ncbi:SPOR domain-containing protein [Paenibacillus sp. IITD108]|uniref:SPOR domain-containing protein n=1 Tax=Paenibacillus sp. IITD108 TaxID=3116649 RepID=UPI002F42F45F
MYTGVNRNHRITFRFDNKGKSIPTNEDDHKEEQCPPQDGGQADIDNNYSEHNKEENMQSDPEITSFYEEITEDAWKYEETQKAGDIKASRSDQLKEREETMPHALQQHSVMDSLKDINPWNSPYQDDITALEQLIRDSNDNPQQEGQVSRKDTNELKTTAAANKRFELQLKDDELGPTFEEGAEDELASDRSYYSRKTKSPSWLNVLLYVAGALTTGALFGYFILTLFMGNSIWSSIGDQPAANIPSGESKPAMSEQIDTNPVPGNNQAQQKPLDGAVKAVSLAGGSQSYYMLQFGLFNQKESRDAALQQLTSKGIAASTAQTEDGYRVYAGITTKKSDANLLVSHYPQLELYLKEVVIKQPQALPFDGTADTANRFFEQTAQLLASWSEMIAAQLEQPTLSSFGEAAAAALQEQFDAWNETSKQMKAGMSDEQGGKFVNTIATAITDAAAAMKSYNDQVAMPYLQTTQQAMMKAVLAQKDWFDHLNAL